MIPALYPIPSHPNKVGYISKQWFEKSFTFDTQPPRPYLYKLYLMRCAEKFHFDTQPPRPYLHKKYLMRCAEKPARWKRQVVRKVSQTTVYALDFLSSEKRGEFTFAYVVVQDSFYFWHWSRSGTRGIVIDWKTSDEIESKVVVWQLLCWTTWNNSSIDNAHKWRHNPPSKQLTPWPQMSFHQLAHIFSLSLTCPR